MELSKGGEGETTFTGNYAPLWDNTRDLQYGKHWVIKMEAVTRVIHEWKQKLASPYGDITLRVPLQETIHRLRTDGEGINSSGIMRDFQKTFLALIDECVLLDMEIGKVLGELGELRRESVALKSKEDNRILMLHDEILKMKASTSDMDELANSISTKTEDLETELSVAISIAREAENANKDLSAEAKQIKTELSGLQDEIRVLKYEAANWKKRAIDARGEIKYLSFSYNAVELKIKELDEESKLKNDEIAMLTSKLNNANNEIQRITEEKKKEYDMLGGSNVQLRAANEGLKQVVQSKDAKIEELKVSTQEFLNYERLRMSHVVGMLEGKIMTSQI
ncbi:hypothetical protein QJS10_CPA01g01977 [Acorus calamus]|uniref:Uncharacterized protein n=1 Tax=Acorus calamus TaxID=4465 RepID=A0AAV9FLL9_ACOCL|nr:hypothetical protein QJS10_CPA01g01977 [Acorus calamus]